MYAPAKQFACIVLGLVSLHSIAQTAALPRASGSEDASVELTAHDGKTSFQIGDPIFVDLVFASSSTEFFVNTDKYRYRSPSDTVTVSPQEGWVRTRPTFWGQAIDGNSIVKLGTAPIRVPVLLNRTIMFQKPGHYQVTLATDRLRRADDRFKLTSPNDCAPCRNTNAIAIDITERDEQSENTLVGLLSRQLQQTLPNPVGALTSEQQEKASALSDEYQRKVAANQLDEKQRSELLQKMTALGNARAQDTDNQAQARMDAATRLAYLGGDDAVRAKVQFLVDESQFTGADPIGPILRDGLPCARNRQLQLSLLEDAWKDPKRIPNADLQTALRQAKELTIHDWVTEDAVLWEAKGDERSAVLQEFKREIDEIVISLPQRSDENRVETVKFLKWLGVWNEPLLPPPASAPPAIKPSVRPSPPQ